MSEKLTIIVGIANLPMAEMLMSNVTEYIGPYLECLAKGDFVEFYDNIMNLDIDPEDPDEEYVKSSVGKMENFTKVCDEVETALSCISNSLLPSYLPPTGYHVIESKKIAHNAVAITLIEDPK